MKSYSLGQGTHNLELRAVAYLRRYGITLVMRASSNLQSNVSKKLVISILSDFGAPQQSNHRKICTFNDSGADFLASNRLLICKLLSAAAWEAAGGRCRGRLGMCSSAWSSPWLAAARECAPAPRYRSLLSNPCTLYQELRLLMHWSNVCS